MRPVFSVALALALFPGLGACSSTPRVESADAGPADASAGPADAESQDAQSQDAGPDAGAQDAGPVDGGPPSPCTPGRTTADRPDDHAGYQVRANYVLPSDGLDESLDTNGRIATSVGAFAKWFAGQTGGRTLRLDTCGGALDVRFVRLSETQAQLKAKGVFIRDEIEKLLGQAGLLDPQKLESVYYGGDASDTCGGGPYPPALVGHVAAVYLKGTFSNPQIPPCAANPLGAAIDRPGYLDFSALHELMHAIGIVPSCAPHQVLQGHASDSPSDLMYAGSSPWVPSVLDVNHDDYFEANIAGCTDLARSVFLEPLPANAAAPPGWP